MTISSMTGFATATEETSYGSFSLELRSVNNRYLDLQFRLPDDFRKQEPVMRELLTKQLHRGKIECRLNFSSATQAEHNLQLDNVLLEKLLQLEHVIKNQQPIAQSLSVADILKWPGMLGSDQLPIEDLNEIILMLFRKVLDDLKTARIREGEKLKALLMDRIHQMRQLLLTALPRIPALIASFEEKLRTRLEEALGQMQDDRIHQEITLFAGKIDIDEELTRLQTHLEEVEHILNKGGAVGKKLDFMMQELNREANTIGSKSIDMEISRISMQLKVLIEQMREQVQNIE